MSIDIHRYRFVVAPNLSEETNLPSSFPEVIEVTVEIGPIIEEIMEKTHRYRRDNGNDDPVGILLGPVEYCRYIGYVRTQAHVYAGVAEHSFNGFPVYPKASKGISFMVDARTAKMMASKLLNR